MAKNLDPDLKHKVRLLISYDGTPYGGWQRQTKPGPPTVQGTIEQRLSKIFNRPIRICGAGRTDAGVHAIGQVAHFWCPRLLPTGKLQYALNELLPPSIAIKGVWEAPHDFHAMASATEKTYIYMIINGPVKSALRAGFTHWVKQPLDLDYLNACSKFLLQKQDFKSFQTRGTAARSTIREIFKAKWERPERHLVTFTITGSGFLKQMVRTVVGTQLRLHYLKAQPQEMARILAEKDRTKAYDSAPPQGLYLYEVIYPEALDNGCRKI